MQNLNTAHLLNNIVNHATIVILFVVRITNERWQFYKITNQLKKALFDLVFQALSAPKAFSLLFLIQPYKVLKGLGNHTMFFSFTSSHNKPLLMLNFSFFKSSITNLVMVKPQAKWANLKPALLSLSPHMNSILHMLQPRQNSPYY